MPGSRSLIVLLVAGCSARVAAPGAPGAARCESTRTVRVVDETGAPLAGARVRSVAEYRICGPSGLPEGCGHGGDESPTAITDASGTAVVCDAAAAADRRAQKGPAMKFGGHEVIAPPIWGHAQGSIVVEYADWPTARVVYDQAATITMGPGRGMRVEVPADCAMSHVHVTAYALDAGSVVRATPLAGGLRTKHYQLDGLGPWHYWVRSTDDRSGNSMLEKDACGSFVRFADARQPWPTLVLDHSDAALHFPALAGGRATVKPFRSEDVIAEATLDGEGRATLALPTTSGTAYCLRIERDGECTITYARAGEVARPGLYAGRDAEIAASCGRCAP